MTRPLTLITGGTRGIGAATAVELADQGHDLVLSYRQDHDAARRTAEAVREHGGDCALVQADLADTAGIDAVFTAASRIGRLGAVVNNAGSTTHLGTLAETPVRTIRESIDINLTGAILVARAAVRAMGRSYGGDGGVIVNVSSSAATIGAPGEYVYYAAAKAGLDVITLGLGKEVASEGIRVVGVAPGLVRTDIHASAGDAGRLDRIAPNVPLQRPGEPEEIAAAIAWLISDEASYVTGSTLRVSGGR